MVVALERDIHPNHVMRSMLLGHHAPCAWNYSNFVGPANDQNIDRSLLGTKFPKQMMYRNVPFQYRWINMEIVFLSAWFWWFSRNSWMYSVRLLIVLQIKARYNWICWNIFAGGLWYDGYQHSPGYKFSQISSCCPSTPSMAYCAKNSSFSITDHSFRFELIAVPILLNDTPFLVMLNVARFESLANVATISIEICHISLYSTSI